MNSFPLRYSDDTDRAYGVAGMSIVMVLWDAEPYLASVSLDSPVGESIQFTPAFGFTSNPRLMASLAWREHVARFQLTSAMIMGNAFCRWYVRNTMPLSFEAARALRAAILEHGHESSQLDDDEIENVYNRTQRDLTRIFSHSAISTVAHNLANELVRRRSLSASEVFEMLRTLNSF